MKKLPYVFLGLGVVFIALSIGLTSYSNVKYNRLLESFNSSSEDLSDLEHLKEENTQEYKITEDMIGIIEIPSIELKYPILEGTDKDVLKTAVGHFESSALPGEGSNMTLIGHNNFILAEPFKYLNKVIEGDLVHIITSEEKYTYEVTKIYKVDPYDKDVVKESEDTKLTLITCTSKDSERLVVEALLVPDDIVNNLEDQTQE